MRVKSKLSGRCFEVKNTLQYLEVKQLVRNPERHYSEVTLTKGFYIGYWVGDRDMCERYLLPTEVEVL
jgi:hypothetical protein